MKKIIALAMMAAMLLSLSACKLKKDMTADEIKESMSAIESQRAAESLKVEQEYLEGITEHADDEIGKTKKGERLVLKVGSPTGYEYRVFEFDRHEIAKKVLFYKFYNTEENYQVMLDAGDTITKKIVDHDKKARMIVYSLKEVHKESFDILYETYSDENVAKYGYEIIE